jgi:hypothetical protein
MEDGVSGKRRNHETAAIPCFVLVDSHVAWRGRTIGGPAHALGSESQRFVVISNAEPPAHVHAAP